ncbi:MAG: N-acetylmuramoyl-L-alanine amidase [Acidobacteria bacterium]|nr:N-acetylmuramoyl-L-alanine amidase [Acidobacteriota bacterium]
MVHHTGGRNFQNRGSGKTILDFEDLDGFQISDHYIIGPEPLGVIFQVLEDLRRPFRASLDLSDQDRFFIRRESDEIGVEF